MAKVFSDNSAMVLRYLQEHDGEDLNAIQIAEELGISARSANGIITGLQKKGLTVREEVDGYEKKIIYLTDEGRNADPDAEKEDE